MSQSEDTPASAAPGAHRAARTAVPSWGPPRPTDEEFPDLRALVDHHGEATLDECQLVAADRTREEHTDKGRGFATPRGTQDAVRVYGAATQFMVQAPDELKKLVKLAPAVLRLGAWSAWQADLRYNLKNERAIAQRTAKKALGSRLGQTTGEARSLRDQLATQLLNVAGADPTLRARIDTALTPAAAGKTETGPGVALASLVAIGREMLASAQKELRTRVEMFCLDEEFLAECEAVSDGSRAATKTAETPKGAQVLNQGDVDLWDGLNLAIMERVVDAFLLAHGRDKRVPKLAFVTLRSYVNGTRGKRAAKEPKGPVDPVTGPTDPT